VLGQFDAFSTSFCCVQQMVQDNAVCATSEDEKNKKTEKKLKHQNLGMERNIIGPKFGRFFIFFIF
jgi:hypothetical protein